MTKKLMTMLITLGIALTMLTVSLVNITGMIIDSVKVEEKNNYASQAYENLVHADYQYKNNDTEPLPSVIIAKVSWSDDEWYTATNIDDSNDVVCFSQDEFGEYQLGDYVEIIFDNDDIVCVTMVNALDYLQGENF